MNDRVPVFVWRTQVNPPLGVIAGRCLYCGSKLKRRADVSDLTRALVVSRERERYGGKLYSEMTPADWEPFRQRAIETNRTSIANGVDDWLEPETLEDDHDLFMLSYPFSGGCWRCGWWLDCISHNHSANVERTACGALRAFEINDSDLLIPEVQSHLAGHFADIQRLTPRRFEELVGNVYAQMGWQVTLTKQSRDGGVDLICLQNSGSRMCLVECKRYSARRRVGVAVVDRLMGVAFRNGATQAHVVTTTRFTRPAEIAANAASQNGIEMNLIDAHELAQELQLYADRALSVRDIEAIFTHEETQQCG